MQPASCTPMLQLKQSPSWVEEKPDVTCAGLIHGKLLNSIGGSLPPSIRPGQKEVQVVAVSTSQIVQGWEWGECVAQLNWTEQYNHIGKDSLGYFN